LVVGGCGWVRVSKGEDVGEEETLILSLTLTLIPLDSLNIDKRLSSQ
jgi:hypothetical protein